MGVAKEILETRRLPGRSLGSFHDYHFPPNFDSSLQQLVMKNTMSNAIVFQLPTTRETGRGESCRELDLSSANDALLRYVLAQANQDTR